MENLKTINIKGKEYVPVNERINYFRSSDEFKGWSMESEIVSLTETDILIKAVIKDTTGRVIATGFAQESKDASMINKTSYVENCESSAWGRALANLGIGVVTSVASAEEVSHAVQQQNTFQQQSYQPRQEETVVLSLEDGSDVVYTKKHSNKNNKDFWVTNDERAKKFLSIEEMQTILGGNH